MNAKKIALAALGAAFIFGAVAPASFAAPGPKGHGPRHEMGGPAMKDRAFIHLLKNADADKDGKVSQAEATAFGEKTFAEMDADKDSALTPGEFRAFRKARMEAFRKDHPRPDREDAARDDAGPQGEERAEGKGGKRHHAHAEGPGRHGKGKGAMGFIRFADADENGQVSKAEATAASQKFFAFMDTNKDGAISIDDLPDRPF